VTRAARRVRTACVIGFSRLGFEGGDLLFMRILIVEDSVRLARSLQTGLRRLGHAVDTVHDGKAGIAYARLNPYDAVVLDIMLPEQDGLTVLRSLRSTGDETPILLLTAKDTVADRVAGLGAGADDYLVKPFAFDELHARIQALVRRRFKQKSPVITVGEIKIDTSLHIAYQDANCFSLTPTEMSILEYLALNRGRVISPDRLINQIYDANSYASRNAIEAHISSLRKKLRNQGGAEIIETRRGFGYLIA